MYAVAHMVWNRRTIRPHPVLAVEDGVRAEIVGTYAMKCLLMWIVIRKNAARDALRGLPFYDFVLMFMYIMRDGLITSRTARFNRSVTIMPPDPFLEYFLPSEINIEKGNGEAQTKFTSSVNYTKGVMRIKDAVLSAVEQYFVSPEAMTPESISYTDIREEDLPMTPTTPQQKVGTSDQTVAREAKRRRVMNKKK